MSKKALTLSIVIPARNEERYLKACLDSIAVQTIRPNEVIVVDNGSTDKTAAIARSYPFVELISEKKTGIVFARNAGFNAANSDVIGRIDADSRLSDGWVEQTLQFFASQPKAAAVAGDFYFYDFAFKRFGHWGFNFLYYRIQRLITGNEVMLGAGMALRREAWQKVASLCHQDTDIAEDIDLSINLHRLGLSVSRSLTLKVDISMLRGNLRPLNTFRYLARWPKTYWRNQMYLSSALVYFLRIIVVASAFVLYPTTVFTARKNRQIY